MENLMASVISAWSPWCQVPRPSRGIGWPVCSGSDLGRGLSVTDMVEPGLVYRQSCD